MTKIRVKTTRIEKLFIKNEKLKYIKIKETL